MTSRAKHLAQAAAIAAGAFIAATSVHASQCVPVAGSGSYIGPHGPTSVPLIIYAHTDNARTAFNLLVPGGALGFSGGRDSQPDPEHYTLYVDTITQSQNGKLLPDTPAQGVCTLLVNADASRFLGLECKVTAGGKNLTLSFKDDGKPHASASPCEAPSSPNASSIVPDDKSDRQLGEEAIRNSLVDPDSIQLKWSEKSFIPIVSFQPCPRPFCKTIAGPLSFGCGMVNAKNRMGGYTGYEWFYVLIRNGSVVFYLADNPSDPSPLARITCQKRGY